MWSDLIPIWEAYGELLSGDGNISYTDIILYLDENCEDDPERRNQYIKLIRCLQFQKLKYENEKLKKKNRPKIKVKK